MLIENSQSKEEIILNHNRMAIEIANICDYMIENRMCLNDTGIKQYAEKIKNIADYWVLEPTKSKGDK
jgi:hypothetical protein